MTDIETPRPIDRTPETPGSGKNQKLPKVPKVFKSSRLYKPEYEKFKFIMHNVSSLVPKL